LKTKEELLLEFRPKWKSIIDWLIELPFHTNVNDGDILVILEYFSQIKSKIERLVDPNISGAKNEPFGF